MQRQQINPSQPGHIAKRNRGISGLLQLGVQTGIIQGTFPNKGLRFPKGEDKRSFMTWEEIERRVGRGGLTPQAVKKLWDCLFLDLRQIEEFLAFVNTTANRPWIFPMCAAAAYTGARRSELCRMLIDDVNLDDQSIVIQERKRVKGQRTFRRVPLTPILERVLRDWLSSSTNARSSAICLVNSQHPWHTGSSMT